MLAGELMHGCCAVARGARARAGGGVDGAEPRATPQSPLPFPARRALCGPVTRARQARSAAIYGGAYASAIGMIAASARPDVLAFALGLIVPGGGFLLWAGPHNPMQELAIGLFAASHLAFLASVAIWFATGNVLLPIAVWLLAALGAAGCGATGWVGAGEGVWQSATHLVPLGAATAVALAWGLAVSAGRRGVRRRERLNVHLQSVEARRSLASPRSTPDGGELSPQDLQLMRLLLDRALQPVDAFEGFEWIDQFQTAAVRYQLNFISYALSIAQSVHLPAFEGYVDTAQRNLAAKQRNHRIWRYWKLENMWGNLRRQADPVPRDNIMFTGFVAAQIALFQGATGERAFEAPGSLTFEHPSGERYAYSLPALIDVLVQGYGEAEFGLLACEPHWIYPLCNAITASAIRACDTVHGTSHWEAIEPRFRERLESEFVTSGGRLVPFRSSITGFAAPALGLAVMQAFPCLFLNAILPDIARRQWLVLRHDRKGRDWRRAYWPVDVGNYRFSRASGYAATAAAAVELGDTEVVQRLLQHLDEDCPLQVSEGVAHRSNASLWSHAVELMARCGRADALRSLVTAPRQPRTSGPVIRAAAYPELLVAKAVNEGGSLRAVLYPGRRPGRKTLTVGGLAPNQAHVVTTGDAVRIEADRAGEARLDLRVDGRTELRITRAR